MNDTKLHAFFSALLTLIPILAASAESIPFDHVPDRAYVEYWDAHP